MDLLSFALASDPLIAATANNQGNGFSQWLNTTLTYILDTVQSIDPVLRTVLAGIAMMLETSILIGLIVPGDTIVLVSSTAVSHPAEAIFLIVAVLIGALVGESIGFALGRFFGPKIRHSALGKRLGEKNWVQAEQYLGSRGGLAVFISRFLPVLHSLIPVTVGMSTMSYKTFMVWTVPATTLWSVSYVSVGALAAGSFRELLNKLHYSGYIFVGTIVLFTLIAYVAKKLLQRSQRHHLEQHNNK